MMFPELASYIDNLKESFSLIPDGRKELLNKVANYINSELMDQEPVKLNFICTHNSRRSHFGQIWAQIAAFYYGFEDIETFSGGTEATAFNPNAVAALERAGFQISKEEGDENPVYEVSFSEEYDALPCFSKTFDDPENPDSDFAAIMTCDHADENCPFIPGAEFRAAVTYRDPKEADGTTEEAQTYDERCHQIATEMFYLMANV